MATEFNPYQAPDAPVVEDFIVVEPVQRPMRNLAAAACCYGVGVLFLSFDGLTGLVILEYRHENPITWKLLLLTPIAYASLAFLLAGRAFWQVRNRRGMILLMTAIGAMAWFAIAMFLVSWWSLPEET